MADSLEKSMSNIARTVYEGTHLPIAYTLVVDSLCAEIDRLREYWQMGEVNGSAAVARTRQS